jgi:hypothetical protein
VRLIPAGGGLPALAPPLRILLLISSPPALDERQRVDIESKRAAVEHATRTFRETGLLYCFRGKKICYKKKEDAAENRRSQPCESRIRK